MKRDARIGLAVVLVLGLMVTLLVGRAIYNSNDQSAEMDGSLPALEGTSPQTETVPAPAPASAEGSFVPSVSAPIGTAVPPDTALNQFVQDQTRNLGAVQPSVSPLPQPLPGRAPLIEEPVANLAPMPAPQPYGGDRSPAPAPQPRPAPVFDDLDHEGPAVTSPRDSAPADGYGYTVQAGDNIWKIASKVYGDGKFSQKIVDANKDINAQKMKPGMVLKIPVLPNKTLLAKLPSFADAKAGRTAPSAAPAGDSSPVAAARGVTSPVERFGSSSSDAAPASSDTKHTVQAGESLSAIAHKYYGASGPKSVGKILAANKGLDPAKLKIGQELTIPAK